MSRYFSSSVRYTSTREPEVVGPPPDEPLPTYEVQVDGDDVSVAV